jgi:hypothetical protein
MALKLEYRNVLGEVVATATASQARLTKTQVVVLGKHVVVDLPNPKHIRFGWLEQRFHLRNGRPLGHHSNSGNGYWSVDISGLKGTSS